MKRFDENGSHIVAGIVGLLVVGVIGLAGYRVWQMQQNASGNTDTATTSSVKVPATIKTKADLSTAAKALDAATTQLNANLDDSPLNSDINSML